MVNLKKKGFTIIELVIVIAVIAVLAAVLIPTFSNLVKKANMSADMQIVKNMNTVLAADEVIDGKPSTVVEAQNVLIANGISNFKTHNTDNQYYWYGEDNRVLLWDKENSKVVYPEEYVKKYQDIDEVQDEWSVLGYSYETRIEDSDDLAENLLSAVKNAKDGTLIQLPENSVVNMGSSNLILFNEYLINNHVGKTITIDLNGSTLISDTTHSDGEYYGIDVPVGGSLSFLNGKLNLKADNSSTSAISAFTGSHLYLQGITLETNGAAVYPYGSASEVVLDDCIIKGGAYGIGTNARESDNIKISISNSQIEAGSAVFINVPSNTTIYNSTITGSVHGVLVRSGTVEIENSNIVTTDTNPDIFAANNFPKGYNWQGFWGGGNNIPAGTIVVGDYTKPNGNGSYSYAGDSIVTLLNTKLQSAVDEEMPEILLAAYDPNKTASISYNSTSIVGDVVIYGSNWAGSDDNDGLSFTHRGDIIINDKNISQKTYYHIPTWVGKFTKGEYAVNELDKNEPNVEEYDYNATVQEQINSAWGITFTDQEWESAILTFSSATANQLKSITYTKADGTETKISISRINLTNIGNLGLLNSHSTSIFKKSSNCLVNFKKYCLENNITVADSSKFVIGDTDNVIIGVK